MRADSVTNNNEDNDLKKRCYYKSSSLFYDSHKSKIGITKELKTNKKRSEGSAQCMLKCTLIDPSFFSFNEVI